MPNDASTIDEGLKQLLETAVDLDSKGMLKEASEYYLSGSKVLLKLAKGSSLPSIRKHYYERAQECVQRVREISGINENSRNQDARSISHPPRNTKGEDITKPSRRSAEEGDEETGKLREMIRRTITTRKPNVAMSDVAGLDDVKNTIHDAVVTPIKHPELFKGRARQPWKGILLYGPAGCGKTLIAKAVATEAEATFFNVSAGNMVSKWLGESERLVMTLFEMARETQPSVIFLDELDSIGVSRSASDLGGERRLKTQLLTELQGLSNDINERVTLIGATNLPWEIDFALLSRFEKRIHVPLPDKSTRERIFEIHMEDIDITPDVNYSELAELAKGFSGRDISVACREAAMEPIRELKEQGKLKKEETITEVRSVNRRDFIEALQTIKPTSKQEQIEKYSSWAEDYSR
ncbi:MAG: AAA family ATPase [Candidatus Thorarchaeota archaeon]